MSYIERSLGANEKIHYIAHFHWMRHALGYLLLIVGVIIGLLSFDSRYPMVAFLPLVVSVPLFLWLMVPIWVTEIGITDQRIIYKRGLFQRETEELQLRSVEEISLNQDVLGRIFDWGQINLHGTGGEDINLPVIGEPIEMRRALQEAVAGSQNGAPLPEREEAVAQRA